MRRRFCHIIKNALLPSNYFRDPRDGKVYRTVVINGLTWMAENLAYLPYVNLHSSSYTEPKLCINVSTENLQYAKLSEYRKSYGVQYNYIAALMAAPPGWHVASQSEWQSLLNFCGGPAFAGNKLKESGLAHWNYDSGSTDDYMFSVRGSGYLATNEKNETYFHTLKTSSDNPNITIGYKLQKEHGIVSTVNIVKAGYMCIRCVKNY